MAKRQKAQAQFRDSKSRQPRTTTSLTVPQGPLRETSAGVNWFVSIPFTVITTLVGTFLPTSIGLAWTAVAMVVAILLTLALRLRKEWRKTRRFLVVVMVLVLVASSATWYLRRPSEEERAVDALLESVRTADGWAAPPVMYPEARNYLVEHFDAFNPDRPHSWDELSDEPQVDNLTDLVPNRNLSRCMGSVGVSD